MTNDIVLIGGNGFIASYIIQWLQAKPYRYHIFSRTKPTAVPAEFFTPLDLASSTPDQLAKALSLRTKTLIFNAAMKGRFASGSAEERLQQKINAPDLGILLSQCEIQRLITLGSSEEYGARTDAIEINETAPLNPISSYGNSKKMLYERGLDWLTQSHREFAHLRPFNVIGPGADAAMFLSSLIFSLQKNKDFEMTEGQQYRSFVSVRTLVKTIEILHEASRWPELQGKALNVSEEHYFQLKDVAILVEKMISKGRVRLGAKPYRHDEVWHQKPDLTQLKRVLPFGFIGTDDESFKNQLKEMVEFSRSGEVN